MAKVQKPTLQFVLMGESQLGLFTNSLEDTELKMSDRNENLYNISLTQAKRVTLGQIYADAWEECNPVVYASPRWNVNDKVRALWERD
ncbi:hypothetical protein ACEPPN_000836 [Leptodophora sp. 'Broadleaf-Isolate-01']